MEIRLDADTLRHITLFEQMTHVRVKDCVEEADRMVYVVEEAEVGRAIGKGAANLKRLRDILKKEVEVVGWAADRDKFLANLFHRYEVESIKVEERRDGVAVAHVKVAAKDKGRAIGRSGRNVMLARTLAQRHYNVGDVQVE